MLIYPRLNHVLSPKVKRDIDGVLKLIIECLSWTESSIYKLDLVSLRKIRRKGRHSFPQRCLGPEHWYWD